MHPALDDRQRLEGCSTALQVAPHLVCACLPQPAASLNIEQGVAVVGMGNSWRLERPHM